MLYAHNRTPLLCYMLTEAVLTSIAKIDQGGGIVGQCPVITEEGLCYWVTETSDFSGPRIRARDARNLGGEALFFVAATPYPHEG